MTLRRSVLARTQLTGVVPASLLALLAGCGGPFDAGDVEPAELGHVSQELALSGGIRILSDRDPSYALNANGGARDGGPVRLRQDCPTSNSNCRWTYNQGMLVSDTDTRLAVAVDQAHMLVLNAACKPDNPACTWTWSKGQLINDATQMGIYALLNPPIPAGSPLTVSAACGPGNPAAETIPECNWTLESTPIRSHADPKRGTAYPASGAAENSPLVLGVCPKTNPLCTWTFRRGVITSDADSSLQIRAAGGQEAEQSLYLSRGCSTDDPLCTWTYSHGNLTSDQAFQGMTGQPLLALGATDGPLEGHQLRLSPLDDSAAAWVECANSTPDTPACAKGYGCHVNNADLLPGQLVNDGCEAECSWRNPNCLFDVAQPILPTWSGVSAAKAEWTAMFVVMADGDFSYDAMVDLDNMAWVGSTNSVNVLVFIDTPDLYDVCPNRDTAAAASVHCPLYQGHGMYLRVNRNAPPTVLSDLGDVDMSRPATLGAFATFAARYFPANRYSLMHWDHGSGWKGFGQDLTATQPPQGVSIPNGDYAAGLALMTGSSGIGKKLALLSFNNCYMGTWEVATASAPYVGYLVASEEGMPSVPPPFLYDRFLGPLVLQPTMSARDLGTLMVDTINFSLPFTLSETDLGPSFTTLTTAVSSLATALQDPSRFPCVETARRAARGFSGESAVLRDLYDFADKLVTQCNVSQAAAVRDAVQSTVLARNSENPGDPGGLSIYIPPRCEQMESLYYTGTDPWTNGGVGDVWSQQTQWDEFLRGFAPPAVDLTATQQPYAPTSLTANIGSGNSVTLSWAPSSTRGVTYAVFRSTTPGVYGTVLTSGSTSTSYVDTGVTPGTRYYYVVTADGCQRSTWSNEANITVTTNPCAGLCESPVVKVGPRIASGDLGTAAVCHETTSNLSGGVCSEMAGRTLKVNGTTMNCGGWSLPQKRNGGYCILVTAGGHPWASYTTW